MKILEGSFNGITIIKNWYYFYQNNGIVDQQILNSPVTAIIVFLKNQENDSASFMAVTC